MRLNWEETRIRIEDSDMEGELAEDTSGVRYFLRGVEGDSFELWTFNPHKRGVWLQPISANSEEYCRGLANMYAILNDGDVRL